MYSGIGVAGVHFLNVYPVCLDKHEHTVTRASRTVC